MHDLSVERVRDPNDGRFGTAERLARERSVVVRAQGDRVEDEDAHGGHQGWPRLALLAAARGAGSRSADHAAVGSGAWPPPKLACFGCAPPRVRRTAQYLNSGILPNGSSAGFVSLFAAAS